MFKAIANWFNQAAQVLELERDLREEQEFCDGVLERYYSYQERAKVTENELLELKQSFTDQSNSLMVAESCYRSLLRDWVSQREQITALEQELAEMKQKLSETQYNSSKPSKVYLILPIPVSD